MPTNMKIVHLGELSIRLSDLEKLSETERAGLSALAYAVDEVSVFQKLAIKSFGKQPKDRIMVLAHQIQSNAITRVLNAKIFEAIGLYDNLLVILERSKDNESLEALQSHQARLDELKAMDAFNLAKAIRNHSTNHYLPSVVKENIRVVERTSPMKAYFHDWNGNSFSPFGEEDVFLALVVKKVGQGYSNEYYMEKIGDWVEWSVSVSSWLTNMFHAYLIWLFEFRFPDWTLTKRSPYLELELAEELEGVPLPIFYTSRNSE